MTTLKLRPVRAATSPPDDTMTMTRVSADEFDNLKGSMGRIKAPTVALARMVLVDGLTPAEAARKAETTRQWVSQAVKQVSEAIGKAKAQAPKGWVRVDLYLPPKRAAQVQKIHADELAKLSTPS